MVKKTLMKHDGILDVRANVAADLLLVDYEADKVSLEDILAVIRKAGYKALPIRQRLSVMELSVTVIEEAAIAIAAKIGFSNVPFIG